MPAVLPVAGPCHPGVGREHGEVLPPPPLPGLQLSPCNPLPTPTHQLISWLIPEAINTALPQRAPRPRGHPVGQGLVPLAWGPLSLLRAKDVTWGAAAMGPVGPWAELALATFPLAALGTVLCWAGQSLGHRCAWCEGSPGTCGDGEVGDSGPKGEPRPLAEHPPSPQAAMSP